MPSQQLFQLTRQSGNRLIKNAKGLLDLLCESLDRLQQKLQGETPAAPDLWDQIERKQGKEEFRPKDENHFSDYVKRHIESDLNERGIVALREVEIRRGEGTGKGERTDIHVTGVHFDNGIEKPIQIYVIIETKGCWNRDLKTAMKDQLVTRYLDDNICRHGLYLIGWFACPLWNSSKKAAPFATIHEAKSFFDQQAKDLSSGDIEVRAKIIDASLR